MATKTRSSAKIIPFRHSYPKPIIVRTVAAKPVHHRKPQHGKSGSRGLLSPSRTAIMVGGFAVGLIQKMGWQLPKLPLIGEAGTIGIGAYFLSNDGRNKLADEICTAALTIAAYELGSTGQIIGGDGGEQVPYGSVTGF